MCFSALSLSGVKKINLKHFDLGYVQWRFKSMIIEIKTNDTSTGNDWDDF